MRWSGRWAAGPWPRCCAGDAVSGGRGFVRFLTIKTRKKRNTGLSRSCGALFEVSDATEIIAFFPSRRKGDIPGNLYSFLL